MENGQEIFSSRSASSAWSCRRKKTSMRIGTVARVTQILRVSDRDAARDHGGRVPRPAPPL